MSETSAREYAIEYAEHLKAYIPPCPWNPFPVSSPWGEEIERRYREHEAKRRQLSCGRQ